MSTNPQSPTAWQKWIVFSTKAAAVLLMGLMYVIYFTLFSPFALIYRCFSDPLRTASTVRDAPGGFFVARRRMTETRETSGNPF